MDNSNLTPLLTMLLGIHISFLGYVRYVNADGWDVAGPPPLWIVYFGGLVSLLAFSNYLLGRWRSSRA